MKSLGIERVHTGIRNLDEILGGGIPKGSVTVLGGPPGVGKTTLAQQIIFNNSAVDKKSLIFQTLSEPSAKTMKYMSQFDFFKSEKLEESIEFVDLGVVLRQKGLEKAAESLMENIRRVRPAFVIVDSFKVFDDLAMSKEELRKFTYGLAVQLMAWEVTAFLLGEYSMPLLESSALSSVVDGIIILEKFENLNDMERKIRIVKMRGTEHDGAYYPFAMTSAGIEIYRVKPLPPETKKQRAKNSARSPSGIQGFDRTAEGGFLTPSVVLISGVPGSGKSLFVLETLYRGAKDFAEKGILFSYEMEEEQICSAAAAIGLDLAAQIKKGLIEIVTFPSKTIPERSIQFAQDRIEQFKPKRVGFDSLTALLEKVEKPQAVREKIQEISNIVKAAGAVGFLISDVPYGVPRVTRSLAIEAEPDMLIFLNSEKGDKGRRRSIEILKMRNSKHANRPLNFVIQEGGIRISEKE